MAWQLLRGHVNAVESQKAVSPYYTQSLELVINGADADVALDLDNFTGTFWTAVLADGTYGTIAAHVLAALKQIAQGAAAYLRTEGNFILYRSRVEVGSLAANTYSANYNSTLKIPNFTFNAGNGPKGTNVILTWEMNPGWVPMQGDILV